MNNVKTLDDLQQMLSQWEEMKTIETPSLVEDFIQKFKSGGGIHIKKANKGKFTEYCGGKVTEECIAKGKASSDPKIRKRATFAANSRKWNK